MSDYKTYDALRARVRSHAQLMAEQAPKNSRGMWERMVMLIDAYDEFGPWPDLPKMQEPPKGKVTLEDLDAIMEKFRAESAAWNAYFDKVGD
ncbi:MAG: hypothetical protein NVSMB31_01340 [Vulcanimicrobiaceae bacterium]